MSVKTHKPCDRNELCQVDHVTQPHNTRDCFSALQTQPTHKMGWLGLGGLALGRTSRLVVSACLDKTVALRTKQVLCFCQGRLALRRLGRLDLLAWIGKTVALSTGKTLSFGVGGFVLHQLCRLDVSACLCKTVALPTVEKLSFGLGRLARL